MIYNNEKLKEIMIIQFIMVSTAIILNIFL